MDVDIDIITDDIDDIQIDRCQYSWHLVGLNKGTKPPSFWAVDWLGRCSSTWGAPCPLTCSLWPSWPWANVLSYTPQIIFHHFLQKLLNLWAPQLWTISHCIFLNILHCLLLNKLIQLILSNLLKLQTALSGWLKLSPGALREWSSLTSFTTPNVASFT